MTELPTDTLAGISLSNSDPIARQSGITGHPKVTTTTAAKACLSTLRHGEFHGRSQINDDLLLANTAADATQNHALAPAADASHECTFAQRPMPATNACSPGSRCHPGLRTRPSGRCHPEFRTRPGDRCQPELQTRLASHECMRPPADASQNYALTPASACSPTGRCKPKLRTRSRRRCQR